MRVLLLVLLLISSPSYADEIQLEFSNGWTVEFDDTKFANYDSDKRASTSWVHRNYAPISFVGATPNNGATPLFQGEGDYVILSGVYKHTIDKKYSGLGDLSVIEFSMILREIVAGQAKVFRHDRILFETKKKPFRGMKSFKDALASTVGVKGMYTAIELIKYQGDSGKNTKSDAKVTLVSMSLNGVQQKN